MSTPEPHILRPYGDATGDGLVQTSFTLPIAHDKRAEGAALQLANKMGLEPAMVVHAKSMGPDFTFFVVYGRCSHLVDLSKVRIVEREFPLLSPKEVSTSVRRALRRPMVVLGACIGTDAHTVGIDAILNVKGWAGEKGLEAYSDVEVHNLGAQVSVPDLVERAQALHADAVLVSQVVTQRDAHVHNVTQMSAAFREAYPKGKAPVLVIGGPRFDESAASELGVDRIFVKGTTPADVASYLVHRLCTPTGTKKAKRTKSKRKASA
jgi:beta-lysine 5,6-aminomutase beta subunit